MIVILVCDCFWLYLITDLAQEVKLVSGESSKRGRQNVPNVGPDFGGESPFCLSSLCHKPLCWAGVWKIGIIIVVLGRWPKDIGYITIPFNDFVHSTVGH